MARVSNTDNAAPSANHDNAGWQRRGESLNTSPYATVSSTAPTGQRSSAKVLDQAGESIECPTSCPMATSTKVAVNNAPAESAMSVANPYLRVDGRSCSTP